MDIKNALNAILPISLRTKDNVSKAIKSDMMADRDGNGQMPNGGQPQPQQDPGPMSDELLKKALEHFQSLPLVKENNLTVELVVMDGKKFVLIKEPNGKIVRRIKESELWSLQVVKGTDKGQLLSKTA